MVPLSLCFDLVFLSLSFSLFSYKADSKNIRRQNKTLSATVLKLTNTVQHLENENQELKKELTQDEMNMMDSPACRAKGTSIYKRTSKLRFRTGNTISPYVIYYKTAAEKNSLKPA